MTYSSGSVRRTPSGKWAGVLRYRDGEGRWRQVTRTLGATRAEAEAALPGWRALMEAGPGPAWPGGGPTVEEAVRSCLASQLARGRIERSTHDAQLSRASRRLFPALGGRPALGLEPAEVRAWLDALCMEVSPGAARGALSVLRKSLDWAAAGSGAPNPAAAVEAPPRPRPARSCLPAPSVALLEEALDSEWGPSDPRSLAARLALHAGLRAGECCGLRWRDTWEEGGRTWLRVSAAVGRSSSGCYLKAPKNASSTRELALPSAAAAALTARRSACCAGPNGSWFACGERDRFADPRALSDDFSALCARAGVTDDLGRRATFHQLRHTFATRAVRAGVDVRTLADMLGHADADMTLNVYAASGADAMAAAAARLD